MPTPTPCPAAPTRDEHVALPGGRALALRIYGSRQAHGGSSTAADAKPRPVPLVLHFHGGAFTSGTLCSGACVAGMLVEAGAVVVSADYPLAPASPFPAAIEDGHAALVWMARRRHRLAGPDAALWLAGEEAGGNLAAAVALMARDRHEPPLAGQILLSPMLDACVATASLREVRAGPVGCRFADGWSRYLSKPADALHPYAAPAQATRLAGLPPTLLISAGDDPLRDEGRAWIDRLQAAGVPARFALVAGRTGWPASLADDRQPRADWAGSVAALVRAFVADPGAGIDAPGGDAAVSASSSSASSSSPSSSRLSRSLR